MSVTMEELEEAFSEENMFYCSQKLGRQPTPMECVEHYLAHRKAKVRAYEVGLFPSEKAEEIRGQDLFSD